MAAAIWAVRCALSSTWPFQKQMYIGICAKFVSSERAGTKVGVQRCCAQVNDVQQA